jgi:molecular chaperone GrpE (heat shock protein)
MAKKKQETSTNNDNELKELLQRTQASFENFRKQTEKRIKDIHELAGKDILLQLLPILDNFTLALKNTENPEEFQEGIELIYSQFNKMLKDSGVEIMDTEDKKFDPFRHEALMKVESDKDEDMIIEEFQHGYMLKGTVIRHARVKVSAGQKQNPTEE